MKYSISFDTETKVLSVTKDGTVVPNVVSVELDKYDSIFKDEDGENYIRIRTETKNPDGSRTMTVEQTVAALGERLTKQ